MRSDSIDEARLRRLASLGQEDPDGDEEEEEEANGPEGLPKESVITLDLLRKQRTIIISEVVTPKLTRQFMSQLFWLDGISKDPVRVFINTPGGSADDGFAIYDIIRFVSAPVYTICVGLNASAGTIALLGAPTERRFALPSARIMIHQPSGGGRGRSSDIEITADEIQKLRDKANELISKETGRSAEQVNKDTDRDYWMTADEAKKYGLVSRIVRSAKDLG
jgi:ATP-dependent Clp protease protease subunit